MEPVKQPLRMWGSVSDAAPLDWSWVEEQLRSAGTLWVVARAEGHPHPRPVWGVWDEGTILLSLGTPAVRRQLEADPRIAVHLDSGSDVVIAEGTVVGTTKDRAAIDLYDTKYDYTYDAEQYGPLVQVAVSTVLAWKAAGPAGRDGFAETGRWSFGDR